MIERVGAVAFDESVTCMSRKGKPSWWTFYLLWLTMLGLLVWDYWTPRPEWFQKGLALLIVLVFHGLVAWWLHLNHVALLREDDQKHTRQNNASRSREVPLTPVQATYLKAMERGKADR